MEIIDIYYKKYGSVVLELIEKRERQKIEKEIKDLKEMYDTIKYLSKGKLEPLFK